MITEIEKVDLRGRDVRLWISNNIHDANDQQAVLIDVLISRPTKSVAIEFTTAEARDLAQKLLTITKVVDLHNGKNSQK